VSETSGGDKHPGNAGVIVSLIFALGGLYAALTGRAAPKGIFVEGEHIRIGGVLLCGIGVRLLVRAIAKK
jgi:hypothetical protein